MSIRSKPVGVLDISGVAKLFQPSKDWITGVCCFYGPTDVLVEKLLLLDLAGIYIWIGVALYRNSLSGYLAGCQKVYRRQAESASGCKSTSLLVRSLCQKVEDRALYCSR